VSFLIISDGASGKSSFASSGSYGSAHDLTKLIMGQVASSSKERGLHFSFL
jgi:hypothetical protein